MEKHYRTFTLELLFDKVEINMLTSQFNYMLF